MKERIRAMLRADRSYDEIRDELAGELRDQKRVLKAEDMITLMFELDELANEEGSAPDTDWIEGLAYQTGAEATEVDRFWKYCAYGDTEADWE